MPQIVTTGLGLFFEGHPMFRVSQSGSLAAAIADVRDIPARVIPYAAATALTRTVKTARAAVVADMRRVFDRPTNYTINATRIVPATRDNLVARIAVKDQAGGSSTRPESYLLPEVEGGPRSEKRFERALRYSGLLKAGMVAIPGQAAKIDGAGNVSAATIRTILGALKGIRAASATRDRKTGQKLRKGRALKNDLFVGIPQTGSGAGRRDRAGAVDGIWRREGKRLRPLFIFTNRRPQYGARLDFDGRVAEVARERFRAEFDRAAADIINRRR